MDTRSTPANISLMLILSTGEKQMPTIYSIDCAANDIWHVWKHDGTKSEFFAEFKDLRPVDKYGHAIFNAKGKYLPDSKRERDADGNIILGAMDEEMIDMAVAQIPALKGQRVEVDSSRIRETHGTDFLCRPGKQA